MKYLLAFLLVVLFAALIVFTVQAGTKPGEFTCDLVGWHLDPDKSVVRTFECNEDVATRSDTCYLWRTTTTDEDSSDGKTTSFWYRCNEFSVYVPLVVR